MRYRLMLFVGILVALGLALLPAPAVAGFSIAAYSVITNADVDKLWRKVQGPLAEGFNFATPEFGWIRQFQELEIPASLREMTFPVDLKEDRNVTMLPEGGREAHPSTVNAVDATVSFVHANSRFTVAKLAHWAGTSGGAQAHFMKQIAWSGKKKLQAMARVIGDQFYGFSTGYLAQNDGLTTPGTTLVIPLKNAYGSSLIPGNTTQAQKDYITNLFKKGDRVALIRSAALVANAVDGEITVVNTSTPSITVVFAASVTPADNDFIVFSNGANATTIDHTSYNRHILGLLDLMTSTSVQGISSSTHAEWASHADTAGGRVNAIRWRTAVTKIRDFGREDADIQTIMAQGVERDWLAQTLPGLRYTDTIGMEVDGEIKMRGKSPRTSRRVPPGMMFLWDRMAVGRKTIHDDVSSKKAPTWGMGKEAIDDSYLLFPIDWAGFVATKNRKSLAYFTGLTES